MNSAALPALPAALPAALRDALAYVRHPHATAQRAMTERSLADAAGVTVLGIVLTAAPPTMVPSSDNPAQIPRVYALGLTWLGAHRLVFALLATAALITASATGYALTCLMVQLLRPAGGRVLWRDLLVGLGWMNTLSALSATVPLPGVALQIAHNDAYRPIYILLVPPAALLGAWVAVPAWWTLREAAGLRPWRAALAFAVPLILVAALTVVAIALVFQLAWGGD